MQTWGTEHSEGPSIVGNCPPSLTQGSLSSLHPWVVLEVSSGVSAFSQWTEKQLVGRKGISRKGVDQKVLADSRSEQGS